MSERLLRKPLAACVLVFLLGAAATFVAWQQARDAARTRAAAVFTSRAADVAHGFTKRFAEYESLLRAGSALVEFNGGINRDQWREFTNRVDSANRYPGMRTLGFARSLGVDEAGALEQRMVRDTGAQFRVWPQHTGAGYRVVVVHAEPLADSFGELGYDMASDPARRAAIEAARDSGKPAITGKLTLIHDRSGPGTPGFLVYAPVYRFRSAEGAPRDRRSAAQGYVYGAFRMSEAIGPLLGALPDGLQVEVYDGAQPAATGLLFDTRSARGDAGPAHPPRHRAELPLEIGQSRWMLRFSSGPSFEAANASAVPGVIASAGALLTLALVALVYALARTRDRAETLAAGMTRELREAQLQVERNRRFLEAIIHAIPQPVYVKDDQHRWVMANAAATRFLAVPSADIIGLRDEDVLEADSAQGAYAEDDALLAGGAPLLHEVLVKRRDGSTRWGLKSKNAVRMPDGSQYVVGITLDVTDQVEARLELERNRRFLHEMLDAMPVAVCVKDAQHRWVHVNTAFARIFGVAPEALVGRTDADLHDPETAARRFAEDDRVLASGAPLLVEQRQPLPDGSEAWMLKSKLPVALHDGGRGVIVVLTDITAHKQSQAQIESARELLDAVLNASPSPLWVKDEAGRWILINDAAARLLGGVRATFLGRTAHEVYAAEFAQRAARQDAIALASDMVYSVEGEITAVNGEVRWGIKRKRAISLRDGRRILIGSVMDLTQQRAAQAEAARVQQLLNAVFEAVPMVVSIKDAAGRILLINRACQEVLGQPPEYFIGRTDVEIYGEQLGGAIMREDAAARASQGTEAFQASFRTPAGEERWMQKRKRGVTLPDGRRGVVIAMFDITPLRRAAEEVQRAREFLEEIIDSAPQPIFVKDTAHRWVVVNKAFCDHFRRSKEEMLGRTDADYTSPEWAQRSVETDEQALASPVPLQWEEPLERFNGAHGWIVRTKRGVQLRDGTRYVVGMTNDITDLKRAQEELRRHRDNLQQLVDERTQELRRAVDAAQRANQAKSEFLAKMSHELRTPMHAILSFARLGAQRSGGGSVEPDKLAHYFRRIDQSGSRLLALVNDLLDLSRLEAGRMRYDFGQHDLLSLAGSVVQELAPLAGSAGVRLAVEDAGGERSVRCDPLRVAQVLRNLLSNAIRFTPAGGEVRVRLEAEAEAVRVTVEDTGVGIPAEELESIFESFVQSSRTRSNAGGTGLGLPICREIVEAHGGRIWAEVRSGGGSRLVFVLPRGGAAEARPWPARATAAPTRQGRAA
jgi:PAS domain S-box-containing protein